MKGEDLKSLIDYLKENKEGLAGFFQKSIDEIDAFIKELEHELEDKTKVVYFTEAFLTRTNGHPGSVSECWFDSFHDASSQQIPEGYVGGIIFDKRGTYYYNKEPKEWELLIK